MASPPSPLTAWIRLALLFSILSCNATGCGRGKDEPGKEDATGPELVLNDTSPGGKTPQQSPNTNTPDKKTVQLVEPDKNPDKELAPNPVEPIKVDPTGPKIVQPLPTTAPAETYAFTAALAVAFSPDGRHLLSGHGFDPQGTFFREELFLDPVVRIWDLENEKAAPRTLVHDAPVQGVAWSPDGKRIASLMRPYYPNPKDKRGQPLSIVIWSAEGKRLHSHLIPFVTWTLHMRQAYLADSRHLYVESQSGEGRYTIPSITIIDTETGQEVKKLPEGVSLPKALHGSGMPQTPPVASPDGKRKLYVERFKNQVALLAEIDSKTPLRTFPGSLVHVQALAFSADGKRVAIGGYTKKIPIFQREIIGGSRIGKYLGRHVPSANGPYIQTSEGCITVWDANTGTLLREFNAIAGPVGFFQNF